MCTRTLQYYRKNRCSVPPPNVIQSRGVFGGGGIFGNFDINCIVPSILDGNCTQCSRKVCAPPATEFFLIWVPVERYGKFLIWAREKHPLIVKIIRTFSQKRSSAVVVH